MNTRSLHVNTWWSLITGWFGFGPAGNTPIQPRVVNATEDDGTTSTAPDPALDDLSALGDDPQSPEAETAWWCGEDPVAIETPELERDETDAEVRDELEKIINDPDLELPHLPQVPQRILTILRRESADLVEIEKVLSNDQTLSASILKTANTAASASPQEITNLQVALGRMGMQRLQSLMIKESFKSMTVRRTVGGESRGEKLWKRSIASAITMQHLSSCFGLQTEDAFLIGLLHDIGEVVILRVVSQHQQKARQKVSDQLFGHLGREYHQQLGGQLAERWKLPEAISETMRHHHGTIETDDAHAVAKCLLQITDMLVSRMGYCELPALDILNMPAAKIIGFGDEPQHLLLLEDLPEIVRREVNVSLS